MKRFDYQIYAFYRAKESTELAAIAARYGNHCGAYYHMQTAAQMHRDSQYIKQEE